MLLQLKLLPTPDQIPAGHPINRCLIQYPLQSETAPKQGVKFGPSAGGGSRAFPPARRSASRSIEAANCCLAPVEYPEQCSGQSRLHEGDRPDRERGGALSGSTRAVIAALRDLDATSAAAPVLEDRRSQGDVVDG